MGVADDPWALLVASLAALGVPVDSEFEARTRLFLRELGRWNRVRRLTGYRSEADQMRHLVVDSLLLLRVLPPVPVPLLDLGTGPGIPGLILKFAQPDWQVALVEANRRRANFVRHVLRALGFEDAVVHQGRAEMLGTSVALSRRFRTVTMRAVAGPRTAMALARPFLRGDGHLVLPLGPEGYTGGGLVREVRVAVGPGQLPLRRAFLIIAAAELETNVPRGTPGARGSHLGGRQPEGRRGENHNRR